MPTGVALYYPFMNVPSSAWFARIALYWDKTATILPESMLATNPRLRSEVSELQAAGFHEYVYPDHRWWQEDSSRFTDVFLTHVKMLGLPPTQNAMSGPPRTILSGKGPYQLFARLRDEHQLAVGPIGPDYESWWLVHPEVADAYMAYLASWIAHHFSDEQATYFPVTETTRLVGARAGESGYRQRLQQARFQMMSVLPAPVSLVPAADLIKFKLAHEGALKALWHEVDRTLQNIAAVDNAEERAARLAHATRDLEMQVSDVRRRMQLGALGTIGLTGVGGTSAAALDAGSTLVESTNPWAIGMAAAAGLIGVIGGALGIIAENANERRGRAALLYAIEVEDHFN